MALTATSLALSAAGAPMQSRHGSGWLMAEGDITNETPALFEQVLATDPAVRRVYLDSPGGSLTLVPDVKSAAAEMSDAAGELQKALGYRQ